MSILQKIAETKRVEVARIDKRKGIVVSDPGREGPNGSARFFEGRSQSWEAVDYW